MSTIARASIIRGPGTVAFNGATIFSKGDIEQDYGFETFFLESSMHGKLDERVADRFGKCQLTPVGEWESLPVLYPYRTMLPGTSIFTAADIPLVTHTLAGQKLTWAAAAITKLPDIFFGAKQSMLGPMEFTMIGKNNTEWDTADSFVKIETLAFPDGTWAEFDLTKVVTGAPTITWSTGSPTTFVASEGVNISFDLQYDWSETDSQGNTDATFSNLGVMAKFKPMGWTETQIRDFLKFQDTGSLKRGSSLDATGYDLTIANALGSIVVKNAAIKTAGYKFGRTVLRHGELGIVAVQTFTGGKPDPLFTLA